MKFNFTAVDAAVDNAVVTAVDNLDADGALVKDEEAAAGCKTLTVARNTSTKLEGACLKVDYEFEALEGGNAAVKFATAPAAAFTSANMISLKVYGDLSGNQLKAVFANGAEKKTVSLGALDYLGWKDVKASLEGIGEGSYTLQGFVVEQVGNAYGKKGIIYLDKVAQGAAADGVAKVEIAGLRIYPNPASELLIANADGTILGVEVLTLDGRTVARTTTNVVNVSDLAEGAYIAKVYTLSGCESRQIVVKH